MLELMDTPYRGFSSWKRFLLTASLLTLWSLTGAAQLTIIPETSIAVVGKDVLLSLHGLQEGSYASVTWFQGIGFVRSILSYDTETETVTEGPAFTSQEFLKSNGSLIIKGVQLADSGKYGVLVNSKDGELMSATQGFQVYEMPSKPSLIMDAPPEVIEFQSSVKFMCNSNNVDVNISWFLNNHELQPSPHLSLSSDNKSLTIHNVTRRDRGYYQCEVWNLVGLQSSDDINLIVYYGPDLVNITQESGSSVDNSMTIKLGSALTLLCRAASQPVAQYRWSLNSTSSLEQSGSLLTIEAVTWNHQGTYTCLAWNNLTQLSRSATVTINVVGVPDSSLSAGAIAGIVIGALVAAAFFIGLVYFLVFGKRNTEKKLEEHTQGGMTLGQSEYVAIDTLGSQRFTTPVKDLPEGHIYENKAAGYYNNPCGPASFPPPATDPSHQKESDYETLSSPYEDTYSTLDPST
ncbi:cell adhesion molecule CEACAM20 [Notamacropus eugenii]|uniref:cell adhesion molecule CEACAM20 n=1 Tax=Notamacropus eugenii TaxID=9315 RepID=UPI003B66C763